MRHSYSINWSGTHRRLRLPYHQAPCAYSDVNRKLLNSKCKKSLLYLEKLEES